MNKLAHMEAFSMEDLIEESYIDPIRSVLVIDDQFLSLDEMLRLSESASKAVDIREDTDFKERVNSNPALELDRAREIIEMCRAEDRRWLCDIHDGRNLNSENESFVAKHLHQSDLLILDYHLNGNDNENEAAIKLIKELASNGHFNLVVVYTKGYQKDHSGVVFEIAEALTHSDLAIKTSDETKELIEVWEEDDDDILDKLLNSISDYEALKIINSPEKYFDNIKEHEYFSDINSLLTNKPKELETKNIIEWVVYKKASTFKLNKNPCFGSLNFDIIDNGTQNWIKSSRIFVTVINKDEPPNKIPEKLKSALTAWNPSPNRLMTTKVRNLLDEKGGPFEDSVLKNSYIEAGWLSRLSSAKDNDLRWITKESVDRLYDSFNKETNNDIQEFTKKLHTILNKSDIKDNISEYCNLDLDKDKDEITRHLNSYLCSSEVSGFHLTTGHIIEISNNDETDLYICLSPACDLVPERKKGWSGETHPYMPIKLVQLHIITGKPAKKKLGELTNNRYLLINNSEKIELYSVQKGGDAKANYLWLQGLAENQGIIDWSQEKPTVNIGWISSSNDSLVLEIDSCKVISQLRYEYALNLLQNLGQELSRVGLDFVNSQDI